MPVSCCTYNFLAIQYMYNMKENFQFILQQPLGKHQRRVSPSRKLKLKFLMSCEMPQTSRGNKLCEGNFKQSF